MKKWLTFASVFALALVIAACGANSDGNKDTTGAGSNVAGNQTSDADSTASGDGITITAKDWEFDQKEYKIAAGQSVDMTLKSVGGVHGVRIMKTDYNIGNKDTVSVKIDEPGSYEMICSVPCGTGHRLMKATLIVE